MMRNILAVIAGILSWAIINTVIVLILVIAMPGSFREDSMPHFESTGVWIILLGANLIQGLAAGGVCGRIAKHSHAKVLMALGGIELLIGILVQSMNWADQPVWFHVIFLACVYPSHIAGGRYFGGYSESSENARP